MRYATFLLISLLAEHIPVKPYDHTQQSLVLQTTISEPLLSSLSTSVLYSYALTLRAPYNSKKQQTARREAPETKAMHKSLKSVKQQEYQHNNSQDLQSAGLARMKQVDLSSSQV
jgi:hypothetical protein